MTSSSDPRDLPDFEGAPFERRRTDEEGVPLDRRKADRRVNPQNGNHYNRFIPREELGAFAAWAPNSFGEAPAKTKATSENPATATKPAESAPTPDQLKAQLQAELQATHQKGYEEGYRDGLSAMEAFKQQFSAQVSAQMQTVVQSWLDQTEALEQRLSQQVARLSMALAQQVVRSEIRQRPELVVDVAHEALGALMASARRVVVRVNPSDLTLVTQGTSELLSSRDARVLADDRIERGGCLIESDLGGVDARVSSLWQRAIGAVGWSGHEGESDIARDVPAAENTSLNDEGELT